jgi:hypothetical protein
MMMATPPQGVMHAALDAGLLNLQHKALNAANVRPVQLDLDVLRLVRASENSADVAKLLNGAQRCVLYLSDHPRRSYSLGILYPHRRSISCRFPKLRINFATDFNGMSWHACMQGAELANGVGKTYIHCGVWTPRTRRTQSHYSAAVPPCSCMHMPCNTPVHEQP